MHISHKMQSDQQGAQTMILGCGNILLGDDGFGPAVIARLHEIGVPEAVQAIDVGTSIREQLLDYLLDPRLRPPMLVVVDAERHPYSLMQTAWCAVNDTDWRDDLIKVMRKLGGVDEFAKHCEGVVLAAIPQEFDDAAPTGLQM